MLPATGRQYRGCIIPQTVRQSSVPENVYSIDEGSFKENITVMFSFSENGKKCCPMIVYPYKRIPEKTVQ